MNDTETIHNAAKQADKTLTVHDVHVR